MKKYFIHNGKEQSGPYSLDDLKELNIKRDTSIWFEGLAEWTKVQEIDELKGLFNTSPPPFEKKQTPPPIPKTETPSITKPVKEKSKTLKKVLIWGIVIIVISFFGIIVVNNPNSIPGVKVQINTPKPVLINQRYEDISTLLKAKIKVIGTIQNQGGAGNVFVTFNVTQNDNNYNKSKEVYLRAGESAEVSEEFREVRRLEGEFNYTIEVK